ncbi:MAG: PH domain-containing protein [Thermoprotei archaeon]|nr:PH domain-containing protein [Thermoprotei archaeon]
MRPHLLDDEQVLLKCKPVPMAFFTRYLIAIYPLIAGLIAHMLMKLTYDEMVDLIRRIGMGGFIRIDHLTTYIVLLWLLIAIPGIIAGLLRITWKIPILYMSLLCILTFMMWYYGLKETLLILVLGLTSLLWLTCIEVIRRGHEYYLTNYRVITRRAFPSIEERSIFYSRIIDVVIRKGIIGRIFGYGTVIPITASELGIGDNFSLALVGAKAKGLSADVGGGKSIKVPRGATQHVLYGVPKPERVYKVILEHIKKTEESEYLRRITEAVKNIERRLGAEEG